MPRLTLPVRDRDHARGPDTARVTLVEYGDYECPSCGRAHGVVKRLEETLGDDLRFVYRHFPLTALHPNAENAAHAAESAGAQGRYWEMHDALFEHQDALEGEDLLRYAAALDLDLKEFPWSLESRAFLPKLKEDFLSGVRSGVNGTPTFFINGVRHDGSTDFPALLRALRGDPP